MAEVQYTSIVNEIMGKLGTDVYSSHGTTHYVKTNNANPTNPQTSRQQKVRGHIADLNSAWADLTPAQQELWQSFSRMSHQFHCGIGAFLGLNLRLLCADHPSLGCIYSPPPTPGTPQYPVGFCVSAAGSCVMHITWTAPSNSDTFVTAYFHLYSGFCCNFPSYGNCPTTGYRPSWHFIGTCVSSAGTIYHNHAWPVGAQLFYYILSIDKYGRQSPKTHRLKLKVT